MEQDSPRRTAPPTADAPRVAPARPTLDAGRVTPASRPPRRRMTDAEARAFDAAPAQPSLAASLGAEERALAREAAARATALLAKGLLHRLDATRFPVPTDAASSEAGAAAFARGLDEAAFARLAPRLRRLADEPESFVRVTGVRQAVDFRSARLAATPLPRVLRPRPEPPAPERPTVVVPGRREREAPAYARAQLVLRAIHCVRATAPSDSPDDLVFGCTLIDVDNQPAGSWSRAFGEIHTGERADFGELPLGMVDLEPAKGFPKYAYAIFQLVESDRDDEAVARTVKQTLSFVATLAASILGGPGASVVVGAAVELIGGFVADMIDDDLLRPYGVPLNLTGPDPFGGHQSGDLRTGDIGGHGATYRIGYRWKLSV